MKSQHNNMTQASKLSIADKCAITINGDRLDELLMEIDALSDSVSRIIGAKVEQCHIPITSADELARVLADIHKGLPKTPDTQKAINTLDAAIELAFLHSPVYQEAFKLYRLDITGRIVGGDAAYEVIHQALQSALGKQANSEESE
jgi:hypothetical protein